MYAMSKQIRGFSLIELMVGLVVGMIVVAGVTSIYIANIRGSAVTLRSAKLSDELRATASLMANDIRRAGHADLSSAQLESEFDNPFTKTATDIAISSSGNCILFAYDATFRGGSAVTVDSVDYFGFRLNNGVIQSLTSGPGSCSSDTGWQELTDGGTIVIDSLDFSTGQTGSDGTTAMGSRCLDTTAAPEVTWVAMAGSRSPACTYEAGKRWAITAGGTPAPALATAAFTSAHVLLESRQILITVTGHHTDDSVVKATVHENVKVMNDRKLTQP